MAYVQFTQALETSLMQFFYVILYSTENWGKLPLSISCTHSFFINLLFPSRIFIFIYMPIILQGPKYKKEHTNTVPLPQPNISIARAEKK